MYKKGNPFAGPQEADSTDEMDIIAMNILKMGEVSCEGLPISICEMGKSRSVLDPGFSTKPSN